MIYRYNSTNAKLYRWFYNKQIMPVIPIDYYFGSIIAWLLSIPVVVFTIPMFFFNHLNGKTHGTYTRKPIPMILLSTFFYITSFAGFSILMTTVGFFYQLPKNDLFSVCNVVGKLTYGIIAFCIGIYISHLIYKYRKERQARMRDQKEHLLIWDNMIEASGNKS